MFVLLRRSFLLVLLGVMVTVRVLSVTGTMRSTAAMRNVPSAWLM